MAATHAGHSVEVGVSPARFYELVTDFESYPTFVPNQSATRVISREGDLWRVEFELLVAKRLRYVLDLEGEPGRTLSWTLVSGDMMKTNNGRWLIEEQPDGRTGATYEIDVALKGFIPRSITRSLIERTLPANLDAFKMEAERRG